jgi:hypothetical protein
VCSDLSKYNTVAEDYDSVPVWIHSNLCSVCACTSYSESEATIDRTNIHLGLNERTRLTNTLYYNACFGERITPFCSLYNEYITQ